VRPGEFGESLEQPWSAIGVESGDEHLAVELKAARHETLELVGGLSRGEDHLGEPRPAFPVGVDPGETEVIDPARGQLLDGAIDIGRSCGHFVQDFRQLVSIHQTSCCSFQRRTRQGYPNSVRGPVSHR